MIGKNFIGFKNHIFTIISKYKSLINIDPNPKKLSSIVADQENDATSSWFENERKATSECDSNDFFFARNGSADWPSELISNFLHGLGIGCGGGGGDHLELEPRIFAILHFSKESSSLPQILYHQVLLRIPCVFS